MSLFRMCLAYPFCVRKGALEHSYETGALAVKCLQHLWGFDI
jgi:hypothetical protein